MDILLREVPGGYAVAVLTEKGEKLGLGPAVTAQPEPAGQARDWPRLAADNYASPLWAEISERCLSCRACAYVCPTCRCFDLRDEALPAQNGSQVYERVRSWDSCAGARYRQIAGGHNPRAEKVARLRNRFLCKFYYYPEQYANGQDQAGSACEPTACTGCGRCIDACPVNIDIREVLDVLAEVSA